LNKKNNIIINTRIINKLLNNFYKKYRETILINKNLLIAGIVGFLASAVIAELYAIYSPSTILTSTITVLVGFIIYKISFIVLFHIDNKRKYTNRFSSQINFNILKQIIKKMIFAWSIFDIINNLSRWIILYELLLIGFRPFEAAILSSIAASSLSYLSINIILRRTKIFS
jgi:predicted neutral ceramidase superfamily lipid hydrolase